MKYRENNEMHSNVWVFVSKTICLKGVFGYFLQKWKKTCYDTSLLIIRYIRESEREVYITYLQANVWYGIYHMFEFQVWRWSFFGE